MADSPFLKSIRQAEMYGFDVERAGKLEKLARMAVDKGDRDTAMRALQEMKAIKEQADAVGTMTTREKLETLDKITVAQNPNIDYQSDEYVFRGLSDDEVKEIQSKVKKPKKPMMTMGVGRDFAGFSQPDAFVKDELDQKIEMANLARVRKVNPYLAETIDEMNAFEVIRTGAGAGVDTLIKGLGIGKTDDDSKFYKDYLTSREPSAQVAKVAAVAAPFAVAGMTIPQLAASTAARTALGGGLGAIEGNIVSRGEGENVVAGTLLGAGFGVLGEAAIPLVRSAGRKLAKKSGISDNIKVVNDDGTLTKQFQDFADKNGVTIDDLVEEEGALAEEFAKKATSKETAKMLRGKQTTEGLEGAETLAESMKPSPERAAAVGRLELQDVPTPVLSEAKEAQELGGLVAAIPGSQASEAIDNFAKQLGVKADEVVNELGGDADKLLVSSNLKAKITAKRDSLYKQEGAAYDAVREQIDGKTKVNAKPLLDEIARTAEELGGAKNLEGPMKRLNKLLSDKPTYNLIDRERKLIGEALRNKRGAKAYTDASEAELSKLYGQLTQLQEGVATQLGGGKLWDAAKKLTVERKGLEENSVNLFGKELNDPLVPKVESALKNLTGRGYKQFTEVMSNIPKEDQKAVVAAALNGVFAPAKGQQMSATRFSNWYKELSRSGTAKKALADTLPEGGMQRLEDLAEVAKGLSNVLSNRVRTGVTKTVLQDFDKANGVAAKLYGFSDAATTAASGATGVPVSGLSAIRSLVTKQKTPSVEAIDDLIASKEFKSYVQAAAVNPEATAAKNLQTRLQKTEVYKKFVKQVESAARAKGIDITSPSVLAAYILGKDDEGDDES